jgi:hypothetical protein
MFRTASKRLRGLASGEIDFSKDRPPEKLIFSKDRPPEQLIFSIDFLLSSIQPLKIWFT